MQNPPCPHCNGSQTKKNGKTHYGKQNYKCNPCNRQFVEGGQDWFISDSTKQLVDDLLLERISLAGICRVCKISDRWLYSYIDKKYENLPDDLNADTILVDEDAYLADRLEEEFERLEKKSPNNPRCTLQ